MAEVDAAHILFPSDTPKTAQTPEWFKAQQGAAEARLSGGGHVKADADAAALFPSDVQKGSAAPEKAEADAASILFKSEGAADYEKLVSTELDQDRLGAIQDGDTERADALKVATASLSENFATAGTPAEELKEAFAIVRQSAGLVSPTPEEREASFAMGMETIQSDGITDADLNAARAFIRDLETVSPGVRASLEAHGAGNDPKLIRAAIKEAKRRGYR